MKNTQQKFVLASLALTLVISSQSLMAKNNPDNPLLNQNREAVSFSWKVQDNYVPNPSNVISSSEESVEYWQTVSGADLAKGVAIKTTAPGALVRINELASNKRLTFQSKSINDRAVQPLALEIEAPNGRKLTKGQAMSINVSAKAMNDAGSPFPNGTTGFQLKESLGHGTFKVRNANPVNASAQYSIHVFDKQSTQRLSVTRNQANYAKGDMLSLDGDFTDSSTGKYKRVAISDISGFVRTPHGNTLPLSIHKGVAGQFKANLPLNMEPEFGGLYEAYIDADANGIKRRVKTAFAVVKPTANLKQNFAGHLQQGLPLSLNIRDAGRFEVRGVLYGSDRNGQMQPILNTSTAQWLEKGQASLKLSFDHKLVNESGLGAPYELKYLQLMDQSRMGKLSLSQESISIFSDTPTKTLIHQLQQELIENDELRYQTPRYRPTQAAPKQTPVLTFKSGVKNEQLVKPDLR